MKKLLKFSAGWCNPCKMLSKTMSNLDLGIKIVEIDIDEQLDLVSQYQIRSVPTLVLVQDDIEIKRQTGAMTASQLTSFVNS